MRHGFGEVWVVFPNTRVVQVRRPGQPIVRVGPGQTLVGQGPLEGFECPVDRFFPEQQA